MDDEVTLKVEWVNSGLEQLRGATILRLRRGDYFLEFDTDLGDFVADVEGDCCSSSWFYSITGVAQLLGAQVTGFYEPDVADVNLDDGLCRQEYDSAYGITLVTTKGECRIVYRNSSNGYYGGWISLATRRTKPAAGEETVADWRHPAA